MARNTTAMKRGWNYDKPNSLLKAMVDGKEAYALKAADLYGTLKVGVAYEAIGYMIDGYGVALDTGYGAALSNRLYGLEINADTGSTDLTGDTMVGAIRGRTVVGTTQTNCSLHGIQGNIDVGTVSFQGNIFAVAGVMDCYGATTMGSGAAFYGGAANFTIWNENTTTIGAGGVWSGVDVLQNSGKPTLGSGAINPAIHVRSSAAGTAWQYGLYVKASSATTGAYIGTCTTGINIEGTVTLALGIGSTTALTTATTASPTVKVQSNFSGTASAYHFGAFFSSQYTAASTGSLRTVVGQVDLSGTQATASTAQYLVGVHGRAKVSGTAYNTALFVTGVMGQILDGGTGTWTAANHISSIWADWQNNDDISAASSSELFYMSNNANNVTGNPLHVFYIYAPRLTNFIAFEGLTTTAGSMVTASATAGTMTYTVKCLIGATACYLHLYDA